MFLTIPGGERGAHILPKSKGLLLMVGVYVDHTTGMSRVWQTAYDTLRDWRHHDTTTLIWLIDYAIWVSIVNIYECRPCRSDARLPTVTRTSATTIESPCSSHARTTLSVSLKLLYHLIDAL